MRSILKALSHLLIKYVWLNNQIVESCIIVSRTNVGQGSTSTSCGDAMLAVYIGIPLLVVSIVIAVGVMIYCKKKKKKRKQIVAESESIERIEDMEPYSIERPQSRQQSFYSTNLNVMSI